MGSVKDLQLSWRAAKPREIPAEDLLATGDVGLIPWVLLTKFDEPAESMLRRCRAIIDRDAPPDKHEGLLVVTQFLASLAFDKMLVAQLLGGREAMVRFPIVQEIIDESKREATLETTRRDILEILAIRFGSQASELEAELKTIEDDPQLGELLRTAVVCPDLESFRHQLSS